MPKSGGDKQNDKNSEHNHSDFSPRNYLHILYHSLRLDKYNGSAMKNKDLAKQSRTHKGNNLPTDHISPCLGAVF